MIASSKYISLGLRAALCFRREGAFDAFDKFDKFDKFDRSPALTNGFSAGHFNRPIHPSSFTPVMPCRLFQPKVQTDPADQAAFAR